MPIVKQPDRSAPGKEDWATDRDGHLETFRAWEIHPIRIVRP